MFRLCTPGRLRWSASSQRERRSILSRGHHILGNRLRGGKFAGRLHENLQVRPLDPKERDLTLFCYAEILSSSLAKRFLRVVLRMPLCAFPRTLRGFLPMGYKRGYTYRSLPNAGQNSVIDDVDTPERKSSIKRDESYLPLWNMADHTRPRAS